jgi:hypothetical protein
MSTSNITIEQLLELWSLSTIAAVKKGKSEILKCIISLSDFDPSVLSELLQEASLNGHEKVVELLLKDGRADPTANNSLCLRWASTKVHLKVVELLLEDGRADPTAINSLCLRRASNELL